MDIWSSQNRSSYLCITIHYLIYERPEAKSGLVLKSSILAFHNLRGKHSGENISKAVTALLRRAEINPEEVRISIYCP